jgi:4-hydroxybenzoate polyprenyltransferase
MIAKITSNLALGRLLRISRPRFWVYVAGPFAIGVMLALRPLEYPLMHVSVVQLIFLSYFTFPANLLIYGVNDTFDYETDRLNPKKTDYEALVTPNEHRPLGFWIGAASAPFVLALQFAPFHALLAFSAFVLLSVFYSAPPVRAKVIPVFDMLFSAGIYVSAGVFGFYLAGGQALDWSVVLAGLFWSMAMHAYSAVPDIEADRKSGVSTIATWLGEKKTLWCCLALYLTAAIMTLPELGGLGVVLGIVYCGMVLASLHAKQGDGIFKLYTYFPLLNVAAGFLIFLWLSVVTRYDAITLIGERLAAIL